MTLARYEIEFEPVNRKQFVSLTGVPKHPEQLYLQVVSKVRPNHDPLTTHVSPKIYFAHLTSRLGATRQLTSPQSNRLESSYEIFQVKEPAH